MSVVAKFSLYIISAEFYRYILFPGYWFFKPNLILDSDVSYEIKMFENFLSTEIIVQRKKRDRTYTVYGTHAHTPECIKALVSQQRS